MDCAPTSGARGPPCWNSRFSEVKRHEGHLYSLVCHNASTYCPGLLRCYGVAQGLEARLPGFFDFRRDYACGAGERPPGFVQPSGAPIIHSIKDGLAVCLYRGILSRPVKPYSKPIRYIMRLEVLAHDSPERRKYPFVVKVRTVGVGNNEHPFTMVRGPKGGSG